MSAKSKHHDNNAIAEDAKFGVDLIYSARSSLGFAGYSDPSSSIFSLRVAVAGIISNDESVSLGKVDIFIFKVSNALSQGDNFSDLFDLFDVKQDFLNTGSAIFDFHKKNFLPSVSKAFSKAYPPMNPGGDIMLIHRIGISPLVRGQQLGLSVLARVIMDYSAGCSLVVTKPYPLQFEKDIGESSEWNDLSLASFSNDEKESTKKLGKHYGKLGFKKLGRSDYFATLPQTVFSIVKKLRLPNSFSIPTGLKVLRPMDEDEFLSI